jgi:transposase
VSWQARARQYGLVSSSAVSCDRRRSRASYGAGWLPHRWEGSVDVSDGICFAGLDVHARKTAAAAVQLGSGEVWKAQLVGSSAATIEWLRSLPGEVRAVYEAGPTGFELARAARRAGVEVMVCAPGAIPRQPGDRIKTDTRDALKLARLHAAGQLRPVLVPSLEHEALRDLVRAREDLRGDLMGARHRISKLLLRKGAPLERPRRDMGRRASEMAQQDPF